MRIRTVFATLLLLVPLSVGTATAACFDAVERRMQQMVGNGEAPGIHVLIDHKGKVVFDRTVGDLLPQSAGDPPLPKNAIYRIYSMTKPITSVAAMMLVEEGRLKLDDPVSQYLPQFAGMRVSTLTGDEPASKQITVLDLLRHTSGIPYGFFGFGKTRFAYQSADVGSWDDSNEVLVDKIASIPLEHQPGTVWEYSFSTDVLGRVIEVIEGQPLDRVFQDRILGPLGMTDTGFRVDPDNRARIAEPAGGLPDYTRERAFLSGGGGLASTMADYLRFTRMIRNGGELEGVRLLKPETVAFMREDHVFSAGLKEGKYYVPGPGHGFGLGFAVKLEDSLGALAGPVGTVYWDGYAGTTFWLDLLNDLIAIVMVQTTTERMLVRTAIRQAVYEIFSTDGEPGMNCG